MRTVRCRLAKKFPLERGWKAADLINPNDVNVLMKRKGESAV
jgi:hypothetical protein